MQPWRWWFLALALASSSAFAEVDAGTLDAQGANQAPPKSGPGEAPPSLYPEMPRADAAGSPSPQDLYRDGFSLMVAQKWPEAAAKFDELVTRYPGSAEAPLASEMARLARDSPVAPHLALRQPELGESRLDHSGRVELLITTSIFGLWSGAALGVVANFGAPGSVVASGLLGLAGLGVGIWTTSDRPIREGGASLMSTGLLFGTLDGFLLEIMLAPTDAPTQFGLGWAGSALGLGTAALVQAFVPITPGQASLVAGGGFLLGTLTGLVFAAESNSGASAATVAGALMLTTSLGLAAGSVATLWFRPTRGRVVLSELAGIIGGVLVGGTVALATTSNVGGSNATPVAIGIGVGMVAGAGLVLALTNGMNEPLDAALARVVPAGTRLFPPSPTVFPSASGGGAIAGIQLISGSF